jgi:hypothetical protein
MMVCMVLTSTVSNWPSVFNCILARQELLHPAHTGGHDYPNQGDTRDWQSCVDILRGQYDSPPFQ